MGNKLIESLTAVAVAIVGVAIISVLVGGNSQTANVIKSAGTAFSGVLKAAVSPVSSGGGLSGFNPGGGVSELAQSF